MATTDPDPDSPAYRSLLEPVWRGRLTSPPDEATAVAEFKAMARRGAIAGDEPVLPILNFESQVGGFVNARFDLSEPCGDHDHCLYKADTDTDGREFKGLRRPQDYRYPRAAHTSFIPHVLRAPDYIYQDQREPYKHFFASKTGDGWFFLVFAYWNDGSKPRYRFSTAYPIAEPDFWRKCERWTRLHPIKRSAGKSARKTAARTKRKGAP